MRFFSSRVLSGHYQGDGGVFFVTSERGPNGIRAYSVTEFVPETGRVGHVGTFQGYATPARARAAAKQAAGSVEFATQLRSRI